MPFYYGKIMNFIQEVLQYDFLSNALIACILSGITCGIIGTYIVCRRLVFLSGGITHSSFGGIGIAYYLDWNPILGAMAFAILSAIGIEWASSRGKIREDSAIGIVWSVGMAVGIIFIYLTPGYAPNLMSFLFGNILTVSRIDLLCLGILTVVVLLLFTMMLRPIMYVAFDRTFAQSQGIAVDLLSYGMSILMALTIVFSIRSVGIMLLISLLTIPAVIVNSFTRSFSKIIAGSVVVAVLGNIAGLWFSYNLNIPAGAATIFALAFTLIIVKLLPLCCRKLKA